MEEWLNGRGLSHLVDKFKEEKIDEHVVSLMTDEQLKELGLLQFGDRISIKAHAVSLIQRGTCQDKLQQRSKGHVSSLLKRIRNKLEANQPESSSDKSAKLKGNKNAFKDSRRVEVGWLMITDDTKKQVRTKTGGGTRHLKLEGNTSVAEVKEEACSLFFPNNVSSAWGPLSNYKTSVSNFDTVSITDENVTIQQLYSKSHTKLLRLYLCTELLEDKADMSSESHTGNDHQASQNHELPSTSASASESHVAAGIHTLDDLPDLPDLSDFFPVTNSTCLNSSEADVNPSTASHPNESQTGQLEPHQLDANDTAGEVFFNFQSPQTLNPATTCNKGDSTKTVNLKLHRGHVLRELEDFFIHTDINPHSHQLVIDMVLPNGEYEKAADTGGVLRDALSEYWETFYTKRTNGDELKVPALCHAVDGNRWEAVGKIIAMGYLSEEYFPVQLAPCFLDYVVNGDAVGREVLLSQYLKFLPCSDRKVVEDALADFDQVDQEELYDFLSDHGVKVCPSKANIARILGETAHKELLQVPTYVADCWKPHLQKIKPLLRSSFEDMHKAYTPTFKSVWKSIVFQLDADVDIISYLKKLLKELSTHLLQTFLRFCTGADILIGKTIAVRIVECTSEFTRTPVAHTCGCVLEIPKAYSSFVEFRNDFLAVLTSCVWSMDIV